MDIFLPSSKKISKPKESQTAKCEFCLIPLNKTTEYFKCVHGTLPHTLNIPNVPRNFTVLQDLIPIAEYGGHLLLIPNTHFISLASVEDQEGLSITRDSIIYGLRKHFPQNPIFMFEHGPGFIDDEPIACGGCHLDHAHGHIMVLPKESRLLNIQNKMEDILSECGWMNPRDSAIQSTDIFTGTHEITGNYPYIQIGIYTVDLNCTSLVYVQKSRKNIVPSQLLRTVIADVIYGLKDSFYWHWRDILMGFSTPQRLSQVRQDAILFRKITGY